ncbi:MAG TPA: LytR C-terminal domain-containing protein [Actinomycetota bacterium]|nr:LytR C-terminal domain-containing protein [Actinomycetota bacterium]
MSDYTTEAEVSVLARQRRRRSLIVIAVVVLILFFAFWYAWSYYQADNSARASRPPAATCSPYDPKAVTPESTHVNVFNASSRVGLAASVSRSLGERGFVIGKVANDPSSRKAPKVAEIRYGPKGEAQAKLLRTSLPKGTTLVKDKRKVVTVDLALGPKFTTLAPVPTSTALPMCAAPSAS